MPGREIYFNSQEQIIGYLRDAWQAVDEADIPPDLWPIAFSKACDWKAAKTIEQVAPVGVLLGKGMQ